MARETNTLPTDFLLQEYRVDSVLGTGGFGITYKAQDTLLETWVAIKEYFPVEWSYRGNDGVGVNPNAQGNAQIAEVQASGYDWGLSRFLEEARVLARVQHPYVVRVRRYFRANGSAYIVMDFEEGEPLSALLRREQTLSEADLRGMLEEVLPALEAVHQEGYLHRDLKPSNLYVRARDGCVMLIDFGAARQSLSQRSKSITGLVTPGYSPPEQYITRSDHYGPWTDIYALGGVLYRCISGRAPTEAPDRQMWDSLPPAVEAGAGRYSPDFLAMIDKALAMRPEERFQHIEQMRAVLKKLASNESDKPLPSRFAPPVVKREPTPSQDPKKRISSPPPKPQEPIPEPLEDPFSESDLESLLPGLTPRTRLPETGIQAKEKPQEKPQ
ncbi:MAG: serine/threonine-protein kinase, partial [Candidatus Competibacteraceae bacterium]|nr:serine/threonine-protein kinase [Candidatus Competibacteraceae bacterium]